MDDMKAIVKILAAIRASEEKPVLDRALFSEEALGISARQRDLLILKLKKAGYVDGIYVHDDIDNLPEPVIGWNMSKPSITLQGLEYISENKALKKAAKELTEVGIAVASQTISGMIPGMFLGGI